MHRLYGPWAAITGATGLLGRAFCMQLASRGFNLHLIARSSQKLAVLEAEIKKDFAVQTSSTVCDLLEAEKHPQLLSRLNSTGEIGLLILNAGIFPFGSFEQIQIEDHRRTVALNCMSSVELAHQFLELGVPRSTRGLIFVSSVQAKQGVPFMAAYAASKAFNDILAQSLWYESKDRGIAVQSLCPGRIQRPDRPAARGALSPETIASCSLAKLGKKLCVVPGFSNRLFLSLTSMLSPERRSSIMGNMLRPARH
ncbi:MAG: SDR family NAD(P)-dependent oxidoreductase [Leptospirales bacterium]|nr:SDR family NAD(P)-dependent oxidoreductase [Leptospirales bacterium]